MQGIQSDPFIAISGGSKKETTQYYVESKTGPTTFGYWTIEQNLIVASHHRSLDDIEDDEGIVIPVLHVTTMINRTYNGDGSRVITPARADLRRAMVPPIVECEALWRNAYELAAARNMTLEWLTDKPWTAIAIKDTTVTQAEKEYYEGQFRSPQWNMIFGNGPPGRTPTEKEEDQYKKEIDFMIAPRLKIQEAQDGISIILMLVCRALGTKPTRLNPTILERPSVARLPAAGNGQTDVVRLPIRRRVDPNDDSKPAAKKRSTTASETSANGHVIQSEDDLVEEANDKEKGSSDEKSNA